MKYLIVLVLFLGSCIELSENVVLNEIYNLERNKKVVLFMKYAGATVDNSLQISIIDADDKIAGDDVGNVFTADSDHNSTSLNNNSISLLWISNDTIQVEYDRRLRTFIKNRNVSKVAIVYRER
jgi:hypothetical protein